MQFYELLAPAGRCLDHLHKNRASNGIKHGHACDETTATDDSLISISIIISEQMQK